MMYLGKLRYIILILSALFGSAEYFLLPYSAFSAENQSKDKNNLPNEEEIQPFNNMVRKFVSLAEDVVADKKKDAPVTPEPTKATDAPVAAKDDSKENSIVSITSPEAKPANQVAKPNEIITVPPVTTAPLVTPAKIDGPRIQEEVPNVEELKIPELQTEVKSYTNQGKPEEKKESFIQRILEAEQKRTYKKDNNPDKKENVVLPDKKINKKNPAASNIDKGGDVLSSEKKSDLEIIRKSSEPYPTQRPETYKTQRLPDAVSKKKYSRENEHLPKAAYNEEYKKILFDSAASGNLEVLRAMVDNFGDTEVLDELGDTPLIYATMAGRIESAITLVGMGANVNAQNYNGVSALYAAATLGRIDLVKLILARSADPELANKNDKTPLMVAAEMDFSNIAYLLLAQGANINRKMRNGDTALHLAALKNSVATINLLIIKGADVELRNFNSYTPLMVAAENNCEQATALLINAGADINITNPQGLDVQAIAKNKGNSTIVELIESEKIRQNLMAQKIIEERKNKIFNGEFEKQTVIPVGAVATRVKGIPLPVMKPKNTKNANVPKPAFSKEEIAKMKKPGL